MTFSAATTRRWSDQGSPVTLIAGDGGLTTLKKLGHGANKLGGYQSNLDVGTHYQYGVFELLCRGSAAFTAGGVVKLWLLPNLSDSSQNAEDGSDSITPARAPDFLFYLRAVVTAQRLFVPHVLLLPGVWRPLIRNEGGQAFTNTNNENVLSFRPYNEVHA